MRGDALGEPVGHLFEDQVRQLRTAALRRLFRLQRDDLFDQSIGDADIVLGEQVLAGLAQREDVVRPARFSPYLCDVDVAVAGEDVEVAADRRGGEAELFSQLIDRRPAAAAQDAEDRLAGRFHWVGRPLEGVCSVYRREHGSPSKSCFLCFLTISNDALPDAFETGFNELLLLYLLAVEDLVERADLEVVALVGESESDV